MFHDPLPETRKHQHETVALAMRAPGPLGQAGIRPMVIETPADAFSLDILRFEKQLNDLEMGTAGRIQLRVRLHLR